MNTSQRRCVSATVESHYEKGYEVWFSERSVDSPGHYDLTPGVRDGDKWKARLTLGKKDLPPGKTSAEYSIEAFVVSQDSADIIRSIGTDSPDGKSFFFLKSLPDQLDDLVGRVTVTRSGADPDPCLK